MEVVEYSKVGEALYKYTHSSGLKVYMVKKTGFNKAAAYFTTHFGSIDNTFTPINENEKIEVPDGVAHFLEHKMFEMPHGENVFEMFGKYGASANAFTAFNITSYYFWCTQNFKENLKILINFVQTPYFTPENVAKEQGIIGQEIRMYDDDPGWQCYFNMISGLYNNHPIRRDIAGTVETIAEITDKTLNICYNTFYHPSNMTLCLVGDFDVDDMSRYIDDILKPMQDAQKIERFMPDEPDDIANSKKEVTMSVSQPIYCIGFKTKPTSDSRKAILIRLASDILIGKSSQLYNELYNDGLITPGFSIDYTHDATYAFSEISDEGIDGEKVAEKILKAAKSFKVTEENVEAAKRKFFGKSLRVFNDPEKYGLTLARTVTVGEDMFGMYDMLETVTAKELEDVIKNHFTHKNMSISIVNPIKNN